MGWELGFLALGLHLRSGETVEQQENQQWLGSEPGKVFMRSAAAAWGEAHIGSGQDPTVAKSMAAETAAFYCGDTL